MAAYDYARRLSYVDGSRMILAGQSAVGGLDICRRHAEARIDDRERVTVVAITAADVDGLVGG